VTDAAAADAAGAAEQAPVPRAVACGTALHREERALQDRVAAGRRGEPDTFRGSAIALGREEVTLGGEVAAQVGEAMVQDCETAAAWDGEVVPADVVVVGAGAAGLTAALGCVPLRVVVLTKARLSAAGGGGASAWAQGGVASAFGEDDNPALHAADTLAAGGGLNDAAIVRLLTGEGPERVRALLALGAHFDRDAGGRLELGREAAHSRRRILHAHGDATGAEVVRTLVEAVRREPAIRVIDEVFAVDLARDGAAVTGVLARHRDGRGVLYRAPAVVLATGGLGQLYIFTTNPREATADGLAMAARAGARLVDLEFVQFHPTALATGVAGQTGVPGFSTNESASPIAKREDGAGVAGPAAAASLAGKQGASPMAEEANAGVVVGQMGAAIPTAAGEPLPLLTEALRGEGAELIDDLGVRFMAEVHADRELAPRDVVARAIWRRLRSGRRVYLDARRAVGEHFPERFPTVFALCQAHGLDPRVEAMPVVPAAHYHMGGVAVDASGRTSLPGLWACGEVAATGAHGANRLASNSLLEALVFGARVAESVIADTAARAATDAGPEAPRHGPRQDASAPAPAGRAADAELPTPEGPNVVAERAAIEQVRRLMWECVGVERDAAGLGLAAGKLEALLREDTARRAAAGRAAMGHTASQAVQPAAAGQYPSADQPAPAANASDFVAWEARNLLWAGRLLAQAALARRESRGGHYRADHPHPDVAWQRRLFLTAGEDGTARFERQEVPAEEWAASGGQAERRPPEQATQAAGSADYGSHLETPAVWAAPAVHAGRREAPAAEPAVPFVRAGRQPAAAVEPVAADVATGGLAARAAR
jgi:L-aspartate oxidase